MNFFRKKGRVGRKIILVFGTFDGLHKGHLDFFRQAREYGDFLIAVVAKDSTVLKNKGKIPKFNEQKRLQTVQKCILVNKALLGQENHDIQKDPYDLIKKIKPDIICLGYDQKQFVKKLKRELKRMSLNAKIKILKPYKPNIYKSSILNK